MNIKLSQYNFPKFKSGQYKTQEKQKYNAFYKSLFEDAKYQELVKEIYFKINKDGVICGLIKILKPNDHQCGIDGTLPIEEYDQQFKISLIKREVKLTYPTTDEASLLNIKNTEVVVVEKNKIFDVNNKVVRYEEKIMKPNFIIYEG